MWHANFEDSSSVCSKSVYWTQLKELKPGIGITHLLLEFPIRKAEGYSVISVSLKDMDFYYFVTEAISTLNTEGGILTTDIAAEIIGGHNLEHGIGTELRAEPTGVVKSRLYKIERFKYSKDILVPGVRRS